MASLSDTFFFVQEDLLDKLYDVERDREMEHDTFLMELSNYFGEDVRDAYEEWFGDNE